jgi:hypothetical protein
MKRGKTSIVPKWKPPEPKEIVRLRWLLKRGISNKWERESAQAKIDEWNKSQR